MRYYGRKLGGLGALLGLWMCLAVSAHPGLSAPGLRGSFDSLPPTDSTRTGTSLLQPGPAEQTTMFLVDDAPGHLEDVPTGEIGLIEIHGRDSTLPSHQTVQVVRVYTKAFVARHPERFGDVPVMQADTLPSAKDSGQ